MGNAIRLQGVMHDAEDRSLTWMYSRMLNEFETISKLVVIALSLSHGKKN